VGPCGTEPPEVPATEDLMREHGVLNRLLLVYDEISRRILAGEAFPPDALQQSARLIREFIEDDHEQLEERWLFPRFERAGQALDLIDVLKTQHQRGLFVRMYRPHEAREDTVLFPRLRQIVSPHEFAALGEQFEREEQRRFGEDGFARIVEAVAQIEKRLEIYNLAQFTP
jgi:hemerythrin-like domain-containing protein